LGITRDDAFPWKFRTRRDLEMSDKRYDVEEHPDFMHYTTPDASGAPRYVFNRGGVLVGADALAYIVAHPADTFTERAERDMSYGRGWSPDKE
jgi:hypothetical protein